MNKRALLAALVVASTLLVATGCGTPQAKLTYSALPALGAEGAGFPFVVPRTVVRVTPTLDKAGATESVAFTPIPLATAADGAAQLPSFLAVDNSTSAFSWTPTVVSSATYLDELILTAIGTQVTDNRKDVIDAVVTAASLAGAFAAAAVPNCATDVVPVKAFLIDGYAKVSRPVPNSPCWGYEVSPVAFNPVAMRAYPVADLASAGSVAWFPIPACRAFKVRVFACADKSCTSERKDIKDYTTTLSLSDGSQYHRVPLPAKGKISLHTDFCGADTTNEAVGTSDWGLLKQLLSDVKTEKGKK